MSDLSTVTPGSTMYKYADDTYQHVTYRAEKSGFEHVANWVLSNNPKLNAAKSAETVITDSRRKSQVAVPPAVTDICGVTSVKVLGVTFANHLSDSDHLGDVIRTRGSAMAEGPRDALVSRNSATTKHPI